MSYVSTLRNYKRPNQLESIQEEGNNNNKSENKWNRNIQTLEKNLQN